MSASANEWPAAWEVLLDTKCETVFVGKSQSGKRTGVSLIIIAFIAVGFFAWQAWLEDFVFFLIFGGLMAVAIAWIGISQFSRAYIRVLPGKVQLKESRRAREVYWAGTFILTTHYGADADDVWWWQLAFRPVCDGEPVVLGYEDEDVGGFAESLRRARFALAELASRTGFEAVEKNVQRDRPQSDTSCS